MCWFHGVSDCVLFGRVVGRVGAAAYTVSYKQQVQDVKCIVGRCGQGAQRVLGFSLSHGASG